MRGFLKIAKLLLVGALCCASMAACSKDDDDNQKTEEPDVDPHYELAMLETYFYATPSADLLEMADVKCVVTDYEGKTKTHDLNKYNMIEITVTAERPFDPDMYSGTRSSWINLPVTAKFEIQVTPKSGVTPDPERTYEAALEMGGMMVANNNFAYALSEIKTSDSWSKSLVGGEGLSEWLGSTFPQSMGFKCEFVNGKYKTSLVK